MAITANSNVLIERIHLIYLISCNPFKEKRVMEALNITTWPEQTYKTFQSVLYCKIISGTWHVNLSTSTVQCVGHVEQKNKWENKTKTTREQRAKVTIKTLRVKPTLEEFCFSIVWVHFQQQRRWSCFCFFVMLIIYKYINNSLYIYIYIYMSDTPCLDDSWIKRKKKLLQT